MNKEFKIILVFLLNNHFVIIKKRSVIELTEIDLKNEICDQTLFLFIYFLIRLF